MKKVAPGKYKALVVADNQVTPVLGLVPPAGSTPR